MSEKQLISKILGRSIEKCNNCKEKAPDFVLKNGLCFECEKRELEKREKDLDKYPKW